ncbi:MAG TPA: carboxypeptidase regulatory-like domain-containing protein [Terriglobales bacterium]|jgi:hypothetical protein|nr:carboxypeptidase regulatory-like domain-containing protein [Terriglobales bacterium]
MRKGRWFFLVLILGVGGALCSAQQSSSSSDTDAARLPVKRVVLYKNGVGYFEHSARVHGNQELGIDFTTGQLNDVLKSLTVVDLGDGQISDIRYNSIAPLDERLRALRLPFGEQITQAEFLSALRGSRVEVAGKGESATGRLLSVEEEEDRTNDSGGTYHVTDFSIVTDAGEMKNFELSPSVSVRLADHELNDEVGRYLNLVGSSRARDLRRMTVSATGNGDRDIFVSYISEVPVWKSTYRIILPEKPNEKPLLQGWAIVDNTIGEDWKDVQLSLIAGAPQSFIQNISQPLYARRPEVALPESAMLTPQTHEGTMKDEGAKAGVPGGVGAGQGGGMGGGVFRIGGEGTLRGRVADSSGAVVSGATVTLRSGSGTSQTTTADSNGNYVFSGVPAGRGALTIQSPGFQTTRMGVNVRPNQTSETNTQLNVGSTTETVEVEAENAAPMAAPMSGRNFGQITQLQNAQVAQAQELGDYFEYNIKQSITIGKNQSALVPILQSRIDAEKVTLWTANGSQPPLRALWIKNASGLTLDAGTFNIIDSGTFAGEGLIEAVHPNERRLLSYAADTGIRVTSQFESKDLPVSRVQILKGVMFLSREHRDKVKYTIRNADTTARQVVIEHPVREGWKLIDADKPEETSASHYRFRVAVDPYKTHELAVEEVHQDVSRSMLTDITEHQVEVLATENVMTPELQAAFRRVLDQKVQISKLQSETGTRQMELSAINTDQMRIRENMKALRGSVEEKALLLRYTHQLNSQEDRLTLLHKEITELEQKQNAERQKLEDIVQHITL